MARVLFCTLITPDLTNYWYILRKYSNILQQENFTMPLVIYFGTSMHHDLNGFKITKRIWLILFFFPFLKIRTQKECHCVWIFRVVNTLLKKYSNFCKINSEWKMRIPNWSAKKILFNFSRRKSFHIKQRGLILLFIFHVLSIQFSHRMFSSSFLVSFTRNAGKRKAVNVKDT